MSCCVKNEPIQQSTPQWDPKYTHVVPLALLFLAQPQRLKPLGGVIKGFSSVQPDALLLLAVKLFVHPLLLQVRVRTFYFGGLFFLSDFDYFWRFFFPESFLLLSPAEMNYEMFVWWGICTSLLFWYLQIIVDCTLVYIC